LGLRESNMPVDSPRRSARCCEERSGDTEREREATEEEESSMEDWAERRASVRRWAGEHSRENRGSSHGGGARRRRRGGGGRGRVNTE